MALLATKTFACVQPRRLSQTGAPMIQTKQSDLDAVQSCAFLLHHPPFNLLSKNKQATIG